MQYDKIKVIVGIFVTLVFVVLVSFFYFFIKEKGLFAHNYEYYFSIDSAESLNVGMPLKFSGFHMGSIENIALKDDGSVKITFVVNEENRKWIREDTSLIIRRPLLGAPYIEVNSKLEKPLLAPNATITMVKSDNINDVVSKLDPIVDKILKIFENLEVLTRYLTDEDSELKHILKSFEIFGQKMASNDPLITTITGDENATDNLISTIRLLNQNMGIVKNILEDIGKVTPTLDADLVAPTSSSLQTLSEILKDLKQKLKAIDGTVNAVGSAESDIIKVKEDVAIAIEKSNEILEKLDRMMQEEEKEKVVLP